MIASYFQRQAELARRECNMRCPDDCSAPGCWMADVVVEVNLFDLIRLGLALKTTVSSLFIYHCYLGYQTFENNPRYQRLLIKLKKPCSFLQKAGCTVHESKPLNCVLFPEYHQIKGLLPELRRDPIFRKFPCMQGDIFISDERGGVLKKLRQMSRKEEALSGYMLFDTPAFIIDTKPLARQLKKNNPTDQATTRQDYDRLLSETLEPTGIFSGVKDKIFQLDARAGMESVFEKLGDDALMQPLLEKINSQEFVYRLKGKDLKRLRRRIQPPDVIFR